MKTYLLIMLVLGSATLSYAAQTPEPQALVTFVSRFDGSVDTRVGRKARKLRIDYRTWSIAPGTKLDRLPMTIDGDVLYELHSGRLLTRTGDRQIERVPGTFWTVRHAEQQALETLDDSVVLRTVMRH